MRTARLVLGLTLGLLLFAVLPLPTKALAAAGARLEVLGREGSVQGRITDGDTVRLRLTLAEAASPSVAVVFSFRSDGPRLATCTVAAGQTACETEPFATLGWFWDGAGLPSSIRSIQALAADNLEVLAEVTLDIAPRPVVMVHGFSSSWEAWTNYLGPTGYLAQHGLAGFAVGDGQVPGRMNTGNLAEPTQPTNTIFENAAILGEYIDQVKQRTGAQTVDLIAHSMGGLIARGYIDRVMTKRDVAQLIMLGSPMAGTDCANLPASLGLYLPATLELRPSYVRQIFNPQVSHRHGVNFHALAGVPILEGFKSPCTDVPTDLAVSLSSVTAIPVDAVRLPVLHMDLNLSQQVFDDFVLGLLQAPAGAFTEAADPPAPLPEADTVQFSRLFSGHVDAGSGTELTIPIDSGIAVASFALYDTTRSLRVNVTGASGKTIDLNAEKNGLVVVQDPEALLYLGYGFQDPKPGEWRVRLQASSATPAQGADFALTARFVGGAQLETALDPLLPHMGDEVALTAGVRLGSEDLAVRQASASIRRPDGTTEHVPLTIRGSQAEVTLRPALAGLYAIDVTATAVTADGTPIERSAFLAFEAQPEIGRGLPAAGWIGAALGLALLAAVAVLVIQRRRQRGS